MNSVKWAIIVVVALAVGGLGGGVAARQQMVSQLTQMALERDQALQERDREATARRNAESMAANAQTALNARAGEMQQSQQVIDRLEAERVAQQQAVPAAVEAPDDTPAEAPEPFDPTRAAEQAMGVKPNGTNGATGVLPNITPEEGQLNRTRFTDRMRERMQGYFDAEAARTTDPTAQQRLATLREQSEYMLDVMQRMRDSDDEQERAQLQQELQQTRNTVTSLVQEQQEFMLRQIAVQSGVTDPQEQQELMNSMREIQSSPLFRSPMLMWGNQPGDGMR